jgi:hypothetical protein
MYGIARAPMSWNFEGVWAANAVFDHYGIGCAEVLEFEQAA